MRIHPHPKALTYRKGERHTPATVEDVVMEDVKDDLVEVIGHLGRWEETGDIQMLIHAERYMKRGEEHFRLLRKRSMMVRRMPVRSRNTEET